MRADGNISYSFDGSCKYFPSEPWRCDTIRIARQITAALSLVGCFFVIFTIWLFRRYNITPQRMILLISIGGAGNAAAALMGVSSSGAGCKIIAFISTFFGWNMLLWVIAVAVQLFLAVFRKSKAGRLEWLYHYIIWPLTLIISLLPLFFNKYGNSGAWCGIVHDVGWRMGMWYAPLFVVIVALFVLYISIIIKIRFMIGAWERTYTPEVEANKKFLKQEVRPLALYPFTYLLLYIIPVINRIHNALHPLEPIYELVLLAGISATAIGVTNSLVYGLDKDTRSRLTRDQIKNAWYSHFTPTVTIGEYKMEVPPEIDFSGSKKSDENTRREIYTTDVPDSSLA